MKMKKLLLFLCMTLLITLFIASAYAQEKQELLLQINLFSDGSALVVGSSTLNPSFSEISYENGTIYGMTQEFTSKEKERWFFNLEMKENFSSAYVKITLPENAKLIGYIDSSMSSFISTKGKSIVLEFIDSDKIPKIKFDYTLTTLHEKRDYWIYILIVIIIAIAIFSIWFFKKKGKKPKRKKVIKQVIEKKRKKERKIKKELKKINPLEERLRTVRVTLNERENEIIDELLEHKKLKQAQLQHLTKIPKVSLSRHLVALENKNLIIKKSLGKTNIIEINKDFDKKKEKQEEKQEKSEQATIS